MAMDILITDDSQLIRQGLNRIIMSINGVKNLRFAENGRQALEYIAQHIPSILILDLDMPVLNGIEVLKKLQNFDKIPLIIVLSNYSNDQYRKVCMNLGANYIFDKTTEFDEMITVLKKFINAPSA